MEDYKEKYEKALERAMVWKEKSGMPIDKQGILDEIFPELKEFDDEQSKKWILEYLYDGLRKADEQFKGQFKTAIAWLEKQNERPTTINVDKMVDEFEHSKVMSRGIPSLAEVDAYRKGVTDALSKILIREEKDC